MTAGSVKLLAVNLPTTADLFKFEQESEILAKKIHVKEKLHSFIYLFIYFRFNEFHVRTLAKMLDSGSAPDKKG